MVAHSLLLSWELFFLLHLGSKTSPGDSRMEQDHHAAAKSPFHRMGARWRRVADCQRLKRERLAASAEDRLQAFNSQAREACSSWHSACPHKFLSGTGPLGTGRQVQIPTTLQKYTSQVIENSRPVKTDEVHSMQEMLIDEQTGLFP